MLFGRRIGSHQAEDPVGVVGVGGPDLLAVDDKIVAVALGAGLQRGEVRSGIRFGIALAPADQAGGNLRQMFLLLRLGAVFQERRPEHGNAEREQRLPRAERHHLLAHDFCLFRIEAGAAIFLRPVRHGPALVAHPLEPHLLRLRREFGIAAAPERIFLRRHRPPHLRRTIGLEPGAGFAAKFFQIGHGSFFHMGCWIDLSRRIAEFNISLRQAMRLTDVAITANRVYRKATTIEKPEETDMRLKLLSPGEMNEDQKKTYDESIASKRGSPPPPMMAWLNSPEMARHATRLGAFLRFDTVFPAKLSEIAILVTAWHWTSHYEWYAHKRLALKGGMDPQTIEDIRNLRTPRFDEPKAQMIYHVPKALHEGHGLSRARYDEAVKMLSERGLVEIIGLCGYYTMVSMTLNTFEFDLPEGQVSELA